MGKIKGGTGVVIRYDIQSLSGISFISDAPGHNFKIIEIENFARVARISY